MDVDLDDEFELEDFLCIDEEQDTSEQPSTSEANFSDRSKPSERSKGAGRYDRPCEAFRADSSNWPGKSRLLRSRCSPSGLSRTVWKQRVRDPLPVGRHPDYYAFLERRNRERGEVDFRGAMNKEEKRSPENGCSREDSVERKRERRIAQVRNVTEEVTLEEVDCCDSEEEGVHAVMCESDEGHMTFDDASRLDDGGLVVSESPKDGGDDGATRDDLLWAYEEDWPDLLGEVDEEAVRRAANQPLAIENNLMLIAPQLSATSNDNQTSHGSSRSASRAEHQADSRAEVRIESKRKGEEPSDGLRRDESAETAKDERVPTFKLWPRHNSPHQYHRSKADIERPFGSSYRGVPHRIHSSRFHKPFTAVGSSEAPNRHEAHPRKHYSHTIHKDDGPSFYRSSCLRGSVKQQINKGEEARASNNTTKVTSQQRAANHYKDVPSSTYSKVFSPLPTMKPSNLSKEARSETEVTNSVRTASAASSYAGRPSTYGRPSLPMPQLPFLSVSEREGTKSNNFKKIADVAAVATKKQMVPRNTEQADLSGRTEKSVSMELKRQATAEEIKRSATVHGERRRGAEASEMNRALVKPRVGLVPEKIVPPQRTSRSHRLHGSQLQNTRASVRILPIMPVSSSATSAVQRRFSCPTTAQSAGQNVDGKVIMLRKHVEVKPSVPSDFSITVQSHGAETRNVSRTVGNASIIAPQKPETSSVSTASIATKRTVASPIQKTRSEQQNQIVTTSTLKAQMGVTQKSNSADDGAVQTKKPRWTLTSVSPSTCSINDKTSFSPLIGAQQSTDDRSLRRESAVLASVNGTSQPSSSAPKQIKLRLPSLPAA